MLNIGTLYSMMVAVCRYGVVVDGERGNRPNIMAQEDLLSHTVRCLGSVVVYLLIKVYNLLLY